MPLPLFLIPFLAIGKVAAKKGAVVGLYKAAKLSAIKGATAKTIAAKTAVGKTALAKSAVAKTSAAKTLAVKTASTATTKTSTAKALAKVAAKTLVKKSGAEKTALSVEKFALGKGATEAEAAYTAIGVGATVSTAWTGLQMQSLCKLVLAAKEGNRARAAMYARKIVLPFSGMRYVPDFITEVVDWLDRGAPQDEAYAKLVLQAGRIVADDGG